MSGLEGDEERTRGKGEDFVCRDDDTKSLIDVLTLCCRFCEGAVENDNIERKWSVFVNHCHTVMGALVGMPKLLGDHPLLCLSR